MGRNSQSEGKVKKEEEEEEEAATRNGCRGELNTNTKNIPLMSD